MHQAIWLVRAAVAFLRSKVPLITCISRRNSYRRNDSAHCDPGDLVTSCSTLSVLVRLARSGACEACAQSET